MTPNICFEGRIIHKVAAIANLPGCCYDASTMFSAIGGHLIVSMGLWYDCGQQLLMFPVFFITTSALSCCYCNFLFVAAEIIIYQCGCYVLFFDGYLWFSALIDIMVRLISSGILSPSFASRNKNYVLFLVLSKQKII